MQPYDERAPIRRWRSLRDGSIHLWALERYPDLADLITCCAPRIQRIHDHQQLVYNLVLEREDNTYAIHALSSPPN